MSKRILDACCGGRMFWYDKAHADTVYMDCRQLGKGSFANNWNPNFSVAPDVVGDFRAMPFANGRFTLVVFDPPHVTYGSPTSVLNTKYGRLDKHTWKIDIRAGFEECWRVLAPDGVLILKWSVTELSVRALLEILPVAPLFGDLSGKTGKTVWMTFLKSTT